MHGTASSVNIGTIDFTTAAGNYNQYGRTSNTVVNVSDGGHYNVGVKAGGNGGVDLAAAVKELYAHVAAGCMHNSAERSEAPRCHEETRKAVQEDIFSWIDEGPLDEVLWLTGPAGAGKSAIMGTISDRLKESGQLAATYYFSAFAGSLERKSKRSVVATVAYQFQHCEQLDDRVSPAILAAVQKDPAVFRMTLKEQMERLVLRPLRGAADRVNPQSCSPMVILVDGVDECGEDTYDQRGGSRQGDQIEVLSVLLEATKDPAFHFRVIVASRPETWIRRFFTDTSAIRITEIFLDDKYSPDDDIRLFLRSKFAELCRRYNLDPSMWPSEQVISKLVEDASGQFIYAATIVRFVDTPGTLPQAQLESILKINPEDRSNPFSMLDALYTSILRSCSSPETAVLWLKSVQSLQQRSYLTVSAWATNRLFESSATQSQIVFGGLASLMHISENESGVDSQLYGKEVEVPLSVTDVGWNAAYTFYHKSFIDYLGDRSRCGAVFPAVDDGRVDRWVQGRFAQTLKCGGPEVPIDSSLLLVFQRCFLDILVAFAGNRSAIRWKMDVNVLLECKPTVWLSVSNQIRPMSVVEGSPERILYILVHNKCRPYLPCNPGCKHWRRAISTLSSDQWRRPTTRPQSPWRSFEILLDRFHVKRFLC